MTSLNQSRRLPKLEQLEDRCIPGSVLDLLANPFLAALGGGLSLDPVQAAQTAVSVLGDQTVPTQNTGLANSILLLNPAGSAGASGDATELGHWLQSLPKDVANDILLAAASGMQASPGNAISTFAQEAQGVQVIWGESTIVEGSRITTWAIFSAHDSKILAVGATFSLNMAETIPASGSGPAGAFASLDFPTAVQDTTFFNHLEIQPEPDGHDSPPGAVNPTIYGVPHFDFHFYGIPEEQVRAILPGPPLATVPANLLPAGYTPAGPSIAEMGRHSGPVSVLSDPNPLSAVMIAGFVPNGSQMHFIEPMVSQDHLLAKQDFSLPVPMPQTFGREMLYPTQFQATFQGNAWSFTFSDFVSVQ